MLGPSLEAASQMPPAPRLQGYSLQAGMFRARHIQNPLTAERTARACFADLKLDTNELLKKTEYLSDAETEQPAKQNPRNEQGFAGSLCCVKGVCLLYHFTTLDCTELNVGWYSTTPFSTKRPQLIFSSYCMSTQPKTLEGKLPLHSVKRTINHRC